MLGTHNLPAFLLASFLLWITPGTDTMYILARSIAQGRRAGIISTLGISSGILVHTVFAAFGLSAILATSAWAFTGIKFLGAGYLVYLGIQAWRKSAQPRLTSGLNTMSHWQIYRQGIVTNILNPKIAIFFLAFLPQFVDPAAGLGAVPFLLLGILFVIGGTAWCLMIAGFAATVTSTMRKNEKLATGLERATGSLYIVLGLNLIRSETQAV